MKTGRHTPVHPQVMYPSRARNPGDKVNLRFLVPSYGDHRRDREDAVAVLAGGGGGPSLLSDTGRAVHMGGFPT